jgi:hypothetical protein
MSDLEETPKKRAIQTLSEMVGLISAGAGIFAALFYLAGRSFTSGYFEAMNIPHYMVAFTMWEYGEVAWMPLFLYPIVTMMFSGLFWGVTYTLRDWILVPLWGKISTWIKKKIQIRSPKWQLPAISKQARRAFIVGINTAAVFMVALFAMLTLQFVRDFGVFNGKSVVLEKAQTVQIVSATPLTLEDVDIVFFQPGQNADQYFVYSGYRLLTANDGKYYLFREIDPVTCKPLKVYVVEAGSDKQINLSAPESLSNQCLDSMTTPGSIAPATAPTLVP